MTNYPRIPVQTEDSCVCSDGQMYTSLFEELVDCPLCMGTGNKVEWLSIADFRKLLLEGEKIETEETK